MWIKAKDGTLYNSARASAIRRNADNGHDVMLGETGCQAITLIECKSPDEAQQLIDRISQAIAAGHSYFDVSQEAPKWEVT